MGGRTINGGRIHDPHSGAGGYVRPAFTLSDYNETSEENSGIFTETLKTVGSIYPQDMASRLSRGGSERVLFADSDGYLVSHSKFYVKVELPSALLSDDIKLVAIVWPQGVNDSRDALGAKCAEPE